MSSTSGPVAARVIWVALAAVLLVAGLSLHRGRVPATIPPVLGEVPDFALTERSGRTVTRAALSGQPWVADFIFTRCAGMCPALSTRMAELRRRAREAGQPVRFVSFTVDPTHDTPAVLQGYAGRFGADGNDWWFLTGERAALYDLIKNGFRVTVADRPPADAPATGELITHSDRFILVDGRGRIRGYYHGMDAEAAPALLRDLTAVAREP